MQCNCLKYNYLIFRTPLNNKHVSKMQKCYYYQKYL